MENNNKDYIFYLMWEDELKEKRAVGYLAQIDKNFYLLISGRENAEKAYEKGFIGMPGFKTDEIYRSDELFAFFKNRILDKDSEDPCKELSESEGRSNIDSFLLENISGIMKDSKIKTLLEAYRIQEEKKKVQAKNKEESPTL